MSEDWYVERSEPEETYRGKLMRRPSVTSPGGRTRLLYELQMREATLPIYSPALEDTLERLVDSEVVLIGKTVDLSDEGFGRELWLGRVR